MAYVCLAAALSAHAPVQAQAAASAPAASASAAESAMERARRQAASPLRAILEASKARRRPGDAEAAEAAEAPPQRTVNTRVAPLTSTAADAGGAAARAAAPTVTAEPPAVPDTPISTQLTLSSDALQERAGPSPLPALDHVHAAPAPGALPGLAAALPPPAVVVPKLISMVEPALAARTLEEAGRLNELPVELTIRPDGTVAQVAVLANAPRQLVRAVVLALEQWRFEPLPAERVHRVQLVFNNPAR